MILYYAPGGCSFADHIALIETALPYRLIRVDRGKLTEDGRDFLTINPKGLLPALELDDGTVVSGNVVAEDKETLTIYTAPPAAKEQKIAKNMIDSRNPSNGAVSGFI